MTKNILITGANGGIGSSISELLAKQDVNLTLLYHENNQKIVELKNKYDTIGLEKINLLDSLKLDKFLDKFLEDHSIDIFIHSPALPIQHNNIMKLTWNDFERQFNLQIKSFFQISKAIIPQMKSNNFGRIIAVLTSYVIGKPPNLLSDYVVAKHSLLGMIKCMATELGPSGICVNSVSPSMVNTPLTESLPKKLKELNQSQVPIENRLAESQDVAGVIEFLCSKNANYITGENILITGGSAMR